MSGDAGQRAITAWHMGWDPALEASGRDWLAPFLAGLLDDPYSAVRYIAYRSLRRLPRYGDFTYDYIAPASNRAAAAGRALEIWARGPRPQRTGPDVLLTPEGGLETEAVEALLRERDDRPVDLLE